MLGSCQESRAYGATCRLKFTKRTFCFFLSPSLQPSDFSVSLKAVGKNKHFKVQLSNGVYCIGQRRFNTMDELLEHYKKAPIFTSEHGEKLYLIKPLQWPSTHKWALQPDLTGLDQIWPHTEPSDLQLLLTRSFLTSKQGTYWIPTHRKIAGFNIMMLFPPMCPFCSCVSMLL